MWRITKYISKIFQNDLVFQLEIDWTTKKKVHRIDSCVKCTYSKSVSLMNRANLRAQLEIYRNHYRNNLAEKSPCDLFPFQDIYTLASRYSERFFPLNFRCFREKVFLFRLWYRWIRAGQFACNDALCSEETQSRIAIFIPYRLTEFYWWYNRICIFFQNIIIHKYKNSI